MSEPLAEIKRKCEQYWNERGICDEEVHSILEFIHTRACDLERQGVSQTQEPMRVSGARTTAPGSPDDYYIHCLETDLKDAGLLIRKLAKHVTGPARAAALDWVSRKGLGGNPLREKFNPRDVAILGGDPSL